MYFDRDTMTFQSEYQEGFVLLTDEEYCRLLDGRGEGNSIVLDESGMPALEPIPLPTENDLRAVSESAWRVAELPVVARQLEAIEEADADVPPVDLLPGTRKQWLKYRGQVSNWTDTNPDFPDSAKRPVQPG